MTITLPMVRNLHHAACDVNDIIGNLILEAAQSGTQANGTTVKTVVPAASLGSGLFDLVVTPTIGSPTTITDLSITTVTTKLNTPSSPVRVVTPLPGSVVNAAAPIPLAGGVDPGVATSSVTLGTTPADVRFVAASSGRWGDKLRLRIEYVPASADPTGTLYNVTIRDTANGGATEQFLNLSSNPANAKFVANVLKQQSNLVRVSGTPGSTRPPAHGVLNAGDDPWDPTKTFSAPFTGGSDGAAVQDNDISAVSLEANKQGIWALEKADLFNLLCIPPVKPGTDINAQTRSAAEAYCRRRRAMFIVDALVSWTKPSDVISASTGVDGSTFGLARSENAALFFPFIREIDPLRAGQLGDFAPCGAVAGVMARTDATRGVWKAPAGIEATLNGVSALSAKLTDGENGQLNPLGVNCLRSFPVIGRVVWGSRTMRGADQLADQWKYIPVRRLALFLEESLFRGTQWVVFEPNDESLWAQIRLNIGAFMHNLFRQGAFQGMTPRDAYFVKCNKDTTTQNDIDLGIVNIIVGFAPLKPAEFVVIKIQQLAGQIET
jgi:uncharacterized protein